MRILHIRHVSDHGVDRGRTVIGTRVKDDLFFGAAVFIMPPRKMMK